MTRTTSSSTITLSSSTKPVAIKTRIRTGTMISEGPIVITLYQRRRTLSNFWWPRRIEMFFNFQLAYHGESVVFNTTPMCAFLTLWGSAVELIRCTIFHIRGTGTFLEALFRVFALYNSLVEGIGRSTALNFWVEISISELFRVFFDSYWLRAAQNSSHRLRNSASDSFS